MKKLVLTITILLSVLGSFAQCYLGRTTEDIKSYVKSNETLKTANISDTVTCLFVKYKDSAYYLRTYYIHKNKCFLYVVTPLNNEADETIVKTLNEDYKRSSNEENVWYTDMCVNSNGNQCLQSVLIQVKKLPVPGLDNKESYYYTVSH